MPAFPKGEFGADFGLRTGKFRGIPEQGLTDSQRENLAITADNKISFGPLDEGPARCGTILAAAGIGQKEEINS
jgi:hypothetical protein